MALITRCSRWQMMMELSPFVHNVRHHTRRDLPSITTVLVACFVERKPHAQSGPKTVADPKILKRGRQFISFDFIANAHDEIYMPFTRKKAAF